MTDSAATVLSKMRQKEADKKFAEYRKRHQQLCRNNYAKRKHLVDIARENGIALPSDIKKISLSDVRQALENAGYTKQYVANLESYAVENQSEVIQYQTKREPSGKNDWFQRRIPKKYT